MPMLLRNANHWDRAIKRILHVGPPNSRKTTAFATYPRVMGYICSPGELGHSTMPDAVDITSIVWQHDQAVVESPRMVVEQFEEAVKGFIGKEGVRTIAIDGIHKLNPIYVAREAGGDLSQVEEKDVPRVIAKGTDKLLAFLRQVMESDVEFVVCSAWDEYEKDDKLSKDKNAPQHLYPALSGRGAKNSIGEFGMVLFHEPDSLVPGEYNIRTAPGGRVWGCGVKLPMEVAKRIPAVISAKDWKGWPTLDRLIFGDGKLSDK